MRSQRLIILLIDAEGADCFSLQVCFSFVAIDWGSYILHSGVDVSIHCNAVESNSLPVILVSAAGALQVRPWPRSYIRSRTNPLSRRKGALFLHTNLFHALSRTLFAVFVCNVRYFFFSSPSPPSRVLYH